MSEFLLIKKELEKAESIVILNHVNMDGDAVGSAFSLASVLSRAGKNVKVAIEDDPPEYLKGLCDDYIKESDEVFDLAETVIEFLSLFVNLYSLLKIVDHIGRRRGCLHDVFRGIDDTLGKIGRVGHHPLRFRREADKETAHTQHDNFLFHDVSVFNCE